MDVHIEMLVGTLETVSGVVEIDGQVSVIDKLAVLPSDSPATRQNKIIDAALAEQGKRHVRNDI